MIQGFVVRLYLGISPEDRNETTLRMIASLIQAYFDAATMFDAYGVWQGKLESTLVVEIATSGQGKTELARMLADDLRVRFGQESVLLTVQDLKSYELVK